MIKAFYFKNLLNLIFMNALFSSNDLLTLLPGVGVIGISVFIISNKSKVGAELN